MKFVFDMGHLDLIVATLICLPLARTDHQLSKLNNIPGDFKITSVSL